MSTIYVYRNPHLTYRVCLLDGFTASANMYISARHSRSLEKVEALCQEASIDYKVIDIEDNVVCEAVGGRINNFLKKTISGYGHSSIGDSGGLQIVIEGIPLYLTPIIQHSPLYSGTECSTRYLDFSKLTNQNQKYLQVLQQETSHGINNLGLTDKAAKCRAYDIARGYLPLDTITNLTYVANVRELAQTAKRLKVFSIYKEDCYDLGDAIEKLLVFAGYGDFILDNEDMSNVRNAEDLKHTSADLHEKGITRSIPIKSKLVRISKEEDYCDVYAQLGGIRDVTYENRFCDVFGYDISKVMSQNIMDARLSSFYPDITFVVRTDFAAFREIHRHRLMTIPLNDVYNSMQQFQLNKFYCSEQEQSSQYLVMGNNVEYPISGSLQSWLYFCKQRCGLTVHPTVRQLACTIRDYIRNSFSSCENLVSFIDTFRATKDYSVESAYEKRKTQDHTITNKER